MVGTQGVRTQIRAHLLTLRHDTKTVFWAWQKGREGAVMKRAGRDSPLSTLTGNVVLLPARPERCQVVSHSNPEGGLNNAPQLDGGNTIGHEELSNDRADQRENDDGARVPGRGASPFWGLLASGWAAMMSVHTYVLSCAGCWRSL